jgi:hypothetical protein
MVPYVLSHDRGASFLHPDILAESLYGNGSNFSLLYSRLYAQYLNDSLRILLSVPFQISDDQTSSRIS